MKSTRQRIDTSREVRLWIGTIIGAIGTAAVLCPEQMKKAKEVAKQKYERAKEWIKEKDILKKGEQQHKEGL